MSNLYINWRFGKYHLQIGPTGISFEKNDYWDACPYVKWFERY